jgi:hypothetical protein
VKLLLACVALFFPMIARAAGLELHSAHFNDSHTKIYMRFVAPVALTDCDVEFPSRQPGCTAAVVPWTVVVYDASGSATIVKVTSAVDEVGSIAATGAVTLTLESGVPAGSTRVEVTFNKKNMPFISVDPRAKAPKLITSAAKTKDDATIYLSGTFTAAVGSTPEYGTDSKVNQPLKYFGRNESSLISAAATVQTDSKGSADPDGFSWGIPIQHVFRKRYSAQWSIVGMELDKRGNAVNFVSAPSVSRSLERVFFRTDKKYKDDVRVVAAAVGLDLTAGVEIGTNLRDKFVAANKPGETEGAFFRGAPSATAYLIIPQVLRLKKITLTSSYTARIPTTDELFLETRNTKTPIPLLTSQTRNWVQNSLQFNITDYVGIQIKHQYGSIPPAFSFVQNSGSIGLVFSLAQSKSKDSKN